MRGLDFSSWQALVSTLLGLAVVTLIGVGIRLLAMQTLQQRRERENRQINERLRTLIAAYKTLGGSFTGRLGVDPSHLRELRRQQALHASGQAISGPAVELEEVIGEQGSERNRRIRDAVEGALSDIILLGTDDQVRLAAHAAEELVAGRPVHTHELVISLRDFIRQALDLAPIPGALSIPRQGPARPSGAKGKEGGKNEEGGKRSGGGGGGGMGGGMGGGGMGAGRDDQAAAEEAHHSHI